MKFTLEWLLSHIDTNLSIDEISSKLTSLGIDVEDISSDFKKFENFVVGYVTKCEKHPQADKLSLCQVDVGIDKPLQIVCGAHNVTSNMKVIVALKGAVIPSSGLVIKHSKLRGIESQGMLCSATELTIDYDDEGGIINLGDLDSNPGTPLIEALNMKEVVFDVSITPNRGDCFSVRGIAKLLAGAGCGLLKPLEFEKLENTISDSVNVELATDKCPYFSCRVMSGFPPNLETPAFINRRLSAIGQKLIFAPVDIANYICLDIGQPMHIFDRDKIGKNLIVRLSKEGETLDTLDGKNVAISTASVLVASPERPLSIAGVMGGIDSSFSEGTTSILIESAYFDKVSIALSGQKMNICSDSRTRNERGVDPSGVNLAMDYATYLFHKYYNAQVGPAKQYGKLPNNTKKIVVFYEKFKNITGFEKTEWKQAVELLNSMGIQVTYYDHDRIEVITPSARYDLNIEEDIIEEVLIAMGYDNIQSVELEKKDPIISNYTEDKISDILCYNGCFEVKTFSCIDENTAVLFGDPETLVKLETPLTNEFAVLRPSGLASLLKSLKTNQNKSQFNCKFFEFGKKFAIQSGEIYEQDMLTIMLAGKNHERTWREPQQDVSIFDVKELLEKILQAVGIQNYKTALSQTPYYHPGRAGKYFHRKDDVLAFFGEIHPSVLATMGIAGRVVCAEIFLNQLPLVDSFKNKAGIVLSPYQSIKRDFSFVVNNNVSADQVVCSIQKTKINVLQNVSVFDVYKIDDATKAVGIEVTLQSQDSTLNEQQISDISDKIVSAVQNNCAGHLRVI